MKIVILFKKILFSFSIKIYIYLLFNVLLKIILILFYYIFVKQILFFHNIKFKLNVNIYYYNLNI